MVGAATAGDGALVRRAREGDREAFGLLVERYMRTAYAVALSVTKSHEDAEDAAQEAFVVALERLDDCRSPEKFGGWLLSIVRNRARNLLRRETIRATEPVPETASTSRPGPDREAETAELRSLLRDAIGELPEAQRVVLVLHDLEGWKHREIADHLDLPAGTVRSHLHHARRGLRRLLSATLETEESSETSV